MNNKMLASIEFQESLKDTLEQFAEDGCLVDIFLKSTSEEIGDYLRGETHSVRIILVGEDYIVLGPKRPLVNCFVPIESILMVRVSDETKLENEDEIDKEIEKNCFGWQRDWPTSIRRTPVTADGQVHLLDSASFDQSVDDNDLVVVLYVDESKDSAKVKEKVDRLAEEFKGQVIFVHTKDDELADDLMMSSAPSLSIVCGEDILAALEGVEGIRKYRGEIREAFEEMKEDC
jgi:hypothetical protein